MRALVAAGSELLFSQSQHDAAIAKASKECGMAPLRLRRACGGRVPLPLPWFEGPVAVEAAYTLYMSNETMRATVVMSVAMAAAMVIYLQEDVDDPDPTDRGTRVILRGACLALILSGLLAVLATRACYAPRINLWVRWGLFLVTGMLIKGRAYYEVQYPMYIRAVATWSIALKALYIVFETGSHRVATFMVADMVADLVMEHLRMPSPEGVPYKWEVILMGWFVGVAYAFDMQSRVSFMLKCTVYASRVMAEEANRLHRFLIDNTLDMICVHQLPHDACTGAATPAFHPGDILYVSESGQHLTGWRRDDLIGRSPLNFVHEDDHAVARAIFLGRLADDEDYNGVCVIVGDASGVACVRSVLGAAETRAAALSVTSMYDYRPPSAPPTDSGDLQAMLLPSNNALPGYEYFRGWGHDLAAAVKLRVAADAAGTDKGIVVPEPAPLPSLLSSRASTPSAAAAAAAAGAASAAAAAAPLPAAMHSPPAANAGAVVTVDDVGISLRTMRHYASPVPPALPLAAHDDVTAAPGMVALAAPLVAPPNVRAPVATIPAAGSSRDATGSPYSPGSGSAASPRVSEALATTSRSQVLGLSPTVATSSSAAVPSTPSDAAQPHRRLRFRTRAGGYILFEVTVNVTLHGLVCVYRPVPASTAATTSTTTRSGSATRAA